MNWSLPRNRFSSEPASLLRTGKPSGLLTEGILDANVDTTQTGMVRVALWREWQSMLADLENVGKVWSIVRNGHSVLAVQDNYPSLAFAPDGETACAQHGPRTLACHFRAWHEAFAFESGCRCGKLYGVEFTNRDGEIFHRICLSRDTAVATFAEWTQMHQATGFEDDGPLATALDEGRFHPQSYPRRPGTLHVPVDRLRTTLIQTAQREIPFIAAVASEGATQSGRIDVTSASEASGWMILSGRGSSLYVEAEPAGSLLVEPGSADGETDWRLSLVDANDHRLLHLRAAADDRPAWRQLIREFVLCTPKFGGVSDSLTAPSFPNEIWERGHCRRNSVA